MYVNINKQTGKLWDKVEKRVSGKADVVCLSETHWYWYVGSRGNQICGYIRYWKRRTKFKKRRWYCGVCKEWT